MCEQSGWSQEPEHGVVRRASARGLRAVHGVDLGKALARMREEMLERPGHIPLPDASECRSSHKGYK